MFVCTKRTPCLNLLVMCALRKEGKKHKDFGTTPQISFTSRFQILCLLTRPRKTGGSSQVSFILVCTLSLQNYSQTKGMRDIHR